MTNLPTYAPYPAGRPRRLRQHGWVRDMVAEHRLGPADFIQPLFICDGNDRTEDINSMPGVKRYSVDRLSDVVRECRDLGIPSVALFPATPPDLKNDDGDEALNPDNLVCRAVRTVKSDVPDIGVICDVALDPYTIHGQDGLIRDGKIANDETLERLIRQSLNQVEAGCDVIAPSDMMDGRIGAIRTALDTKGYQDTLLLSYAAKYASAYYGPFRDAVGSKSALGKSDKRTYQMNPANTDEAIREVAMDIAEGADMIMVKPGMPYLDIIRRLKDTFAAPTFAYQVSGEYAMLKAAGMKGWLDADAAMIEALLAFKRAGCDGVLSYASMDVARTLSRPG